MNRDTAMKWIEVISRTDWVFDDTTLRCDRDGLTHGSAIGVFCNFLDPNAWYLSPYWPGGFSWHGQCSFPAPKRWKSYTDKLEVFRLGAQSWPDAASIINTHYEAFS